MVCFCASRRIWGCSAACIALLVVLQSYADNIQELQPTLTGPGAVLVNSTNGFMLSITGGERPYLVEWWRGSECLGSNTVEWGGMVYRYAAPNDPKHETLTAFVSDARPGTPREKPASKQFWQVKLTSITLSSTRYDGEVSRVMRVEYLPCIPGAQHEWITEAPAEAGILADHVFDSVGDGRSAYVKESFWHALPNMRSYDSLSSAEAVRALTCNYTVKCLLHISATTLVLASPEPWHVRIKHQGGMFGETAWPAVTGSPMIGTRSENGCIVYYITGMGTLRRIAPRITMYLNRESQFFHKFEQHELKHLNQYCAEAPWCTWWDPEELFHTLCNYTAASEAELRERILDAITYFNERYRLMDDEPENTRRMQCAAYRVSNALAPQYLNVYLYEN